MVSHKRSSNYLFLSVCTHLLCLFLLVGYGFGYTLWWTHWITGFWLIGIPFVMGLGVLLTLFWFVKKVSKAWYPLFVLLLGWPFWQRTLSYHPNTETAIPKATLKVTTYNASFFHVDLWDPPKDLEPYVKRIHPALALDSDILCFQEFAQINPVDAPVQRSTVETLRKAGYAYGSFFRRTDGKYNQKYWEFPGVAIYSKHPIIHKDARKFEGGGYHNGYVLADIKRGNDTIRVISLHLSSMGLRLGKVMQATNSDAAKEETRSIVHQLKGGFIDHLPEIEEVLERVRNSPYPVIMCGDFNEVPTCLSYGKARRYLKNSFEEAGNGFGFTLNRNPKYIRIDNQFYSNHFKALRHVVHRELKSSDHFPVSVWYTYP